MFNFEFVVRKNEPTHVHSDIELFYVMDGTANFTLEDKKYALRRDDFLVVNVDKNHSYTAEGEFLAANIRISYSELSSLLKQSVIIFWCNTAVDNHEGCVELRRVLQNIMAEEYRADSRNVLLLNSLYYEMLHLLTTDFVLNKDDAQYVEEVHKFDARKHEIVEFIRLNFDKQISLEDLSKQLFLSYAYLSKYIKRQFGMGFAEYLNSVRLNYAVSQLLHSDQSVVRIAMESGFASSAALNKAFREKYQMTPTEYRRRWMNKSEISETRLEEEQSIRQQLARHFEKVEETEWKERTHSDQNVILGTAPKRVLKKNWNKVINMGTAMDLLQSNMQQHILFLKDELHFEYVRFWDLYDPDMYLDIKSDSYNFDNLDRVLDFLLKNGLKPYIELRVKPKKILKNQRKVLIYKESHTHSEDLENTERFMRKLIIHLLNRYNTDQVETWFFELWIKEPEELLTQPDLAEQYMTQGAKDYLKLFQVTARVLREFCPTICLGGSGFSLRYGADSIRRLLLLWKDQEHLPDFLTAYCYPYSHDSVDKERNQTRNPDFIRESLAQLRQIMEEVEFPTQVLHVTEWNFSVSNRNVLNDHCMKGAYLMRNMIDCIDLADMMGYWIGSDLYAAFADSNLVLNGSGGLLSKDGLRKPAYYAFDFMNHLGKYIRKKDEHYIISDNGAGNWRIVCHNLKNLNHQYSMQAEDEFRVQELNNLFSNLKPYHLHFDLPGKRGGKYLMRIYSVNQYHGSAQDEWVAMTMPEELSREDVKYLSRITTPRMVLQNCVAENGRIRFDLTLEPNEISYIHVTYQYS